jgi:hypothetical protein
MPVTQAALSLFNHLKRTVFGAIFRPAMTGKENLTEFIELPLSAHMRCTRLSNRKTRNKDNCRLGA